MMAWLSLSKYLIVVLVASFLVYQIYDSGRQAERAQCLHKQQEFNVRVEKEQQRIDAERVKEKRAYDENFMRILNEKQKLQADINRRQHDLVAGGLWIDAGKTCSNRHATAGKAQSARVDGSPANSTGKVRLSAEIEERLFTLAYDAQELAGRYNDLRQVCLPLLEIIE